MQSEDNLKNNLASQQYWDEAYAGYKLDETIPDDDIIKKWMIQYLPKVDQGRCFEVGCFPGRYLTVLGELGYELNGLDLTPRVVKDFPEWLQKKGFKVGEFVLHDFLSYNTETKYDLVCSFGFIEHFTNWENVLEKHISLVGTDGYLVIETPNFRGWFQRAIHYFLDKENYKRHYIPSMNPEKWAKICKKHNFEIIHQGYIGEFQFWVNEEPKTFIKRKLFNRLITNYEKLKVKLKPNKFFHSPYCGIIAKKRA